MQETWITFLLACLQVAGAIYAFGNDGVLAKLLGLFFCIAALGCAGASIVFLHDYQVNKRKGNN